MAFILRVIAALWRTPMHSAEIALGMILIGAGSAALIPSYDQDAETYRVILANGGQVLWAVGRLAVGACLVASAAHDVVTGQRFAYALSLRVASLAFAGSMFAALATGFWMAGAMTAWGVYTATTIVTLWAFGSVSATVRE